MTWILNEFTENQIVLENVPNVQQIPASILFCMLLPWQRISKQIVYACECV